MAQLLKGKAVAERITAETVKKTEELKKRGVFPTLAIIRLGENAGDVYYEKAAVKRAAEAGIAVKQFVLGAETSQEALIDRINAINSDTGIHGVLLFRPLPSHIDDKAVCSALSFEKDMDGITPGSMAGVFMDSGEGYPPCTAEACMDILDYYRVDLTGKKVTVMGRSLVIGKPVAMMAMKRNATVTVCHSRTEERDFAEAGAGADIVIAALGRAKMIDSTKLGRNQVIIDVGINEDEEGKMCGDVNFADAEPGASMITPVPGGVGSVTTAVLMKHVAEAAEKTVSK